jgi:large subunit ribosomal protein L16
MGFSGLVSLEEGRVNIRQIHSMRRILKKVLSKESKFWVYSSSIKAITKKPNEVRLGKGKASVKHWVFHIPKGCVLFEVSRSNLFVNNLILHALKKKISLKSFVSIAV